MTQPEPGSPAAVTQALMAVAELIAPVGEAVDGYRAGLLERGYTASAAEQMSVEYHRHLLASVFRVG